MSTLVGKSFIATEWQREKNANPIYTAHQREKNANPIYTAHQREKNANPIYTAHQRDKNANPIYTATRVTLDSRSRRNDCSKIRRSPTRRHWLD